ncbi:MAG: hypothetical protein AB8H79_22015 [Myxococcota bacterium]
MNIQLLSMLSKTAATSSKPDAETGEAGLFAGLLSAVESETPVQTPGPVAPTPSGRTPLPLEAVLPESPKNVGVEELANNEVIDEITAADWPSWSTISSIAQPADPTGVSVNGLEGPTPRVGNTLTAREPGSRAWGLRLDSTRPGGAGVENERFQAHGMSSGSRGFRPDLAGTQASPVDEPVEVPPSTGPNRPTASAPAVATSVATPTEAAVVAPPVAATPMAESTATPQDGATEPSADDLRAQGSQERQSTSDDPGDSGGERSTFKAATASTLPTSTSLAPEVPFAEAQPQTLSKPAPSPPPTGVTAPAPEVEVPLPPASTQDGPVRVQVDQGLTLEVHSDDGVIDVVVEGDEAAVESVRDLGPTLEDDLEQHGWSLGDFGQRQREDAQQALLHRGPGRSRSEDAADSAAEGSAPTRSLGRGKLVNVIA